MARYALAVGSKETPPFIRMAAVRSAVVVSPLAAQHFLNFFPLPHGHGSFRPTVIFHPFGRTSVMRCGEPTNDTQQKPYAAVASITLVRINWGHGAALLCIHLRTSNPSNLVSLKVAK